MAQKGKEKEAHEGTPCHTVPKIGCIASCFLITLALDKAMEKIRKSNQSQGMCSIGVYNCTQGWLCIGDSFSMFRATAEGTAFTQKQTSRNSKTCQDQVNCSVLLVPGKKCLWVNPVYEMAIYFVVGRVINTGAQFENRHGDQICGAYESKHVCIRSTPEKGRFLEVDEAFYAVVTGTIVLLQSN